MIETKTKWDGSKIILVGNNEEYVWVKQQADDNGQLYYDAKLHKKNSRTTRVKNADKSPLSCPHTGYNQLVKITYEIIDNPNEIFGNVERGLLYEDIIETPKYVVINGYSIPVDET